MTDARAQPALARLDDAPPARGVESRRAALRFDPGATEGPRRLVGRAAVYDSVTDLGPFRERIAPGAFAAALAAARAPGAAVDIVAMLDHNVEKVLGRTKSGTLRLADSPAALLFEIDVPDTTAGRDALALALRGDLGGCSVGFHVTEETTERDAEGDVRVIVRADLVEISVVQAWPGYAATSVEARHRADPALDADRAPSARLARMRRFLLTIGR